MARMIPPEVIASCSSAGERELFFKLRADSQTREWIVLHSLNLARHRKQVSGEIDFLILVPNKGVLCLEVKGCSSLRCENGMWFYGRDAQGDPRGPFRQASEAMHSLRSKIQRQCPQLSHVLFWSAVLFPYVEFSIASPEWHPWQVIDAAHFRSAPSSETILTVLENARDYLAATKTARWFRPNSASPTSEECARLLAFLRPDFELHEDMRSHARRSDAELQRFTEEQFDCLDSMENNERVLFSGPAGTGKTLLALEAAKRAQLAGRKVLFLCYNKHLGKWLRQQISSIPTSVVCRTLHSFLLELSGLPQAPQNADYHFWQTTLPQMCLKNGSDNTGSPLLFDEVIVDEAQDILREQYLPLLDMFVKGGLAAGRCRLFGDFEKQAIYGPVSPDITAILQRSGFAFYSLRTNCRNLPRIAALVHLLGGLEPDYKRIRRPDNGKDSEPAYRFYQNREEAAAILVETVRSFVNKGCAPRDLIVLSPKSDRDCLAANITGARAEMFRPLDQAAPDKVPFTSVQAFKGLEAHVVIITDIEHLDSGQAEDLFYVGITRALDALVVLMADSVKVDIMKALQKRALLPEGEHVNSH